MYFFLVQRSCHRNPAYKERAREKQNNEKKTHVTTMAFVNFPLIFSSQHLGIPYNIMTCLLGTRWNSNSSHLEGCSVLNCFGREPSAIEISGEYCCSMDVVCSVLPSSTRMVCVESRGALVTVVSLVTNSTVVVSLMFG